MAYQKIFKRYELKYLINIEKYKIISTVLRDYMRIDKFGKSLICNIYYDTDTFLLIRRSLDKPIYKEKIRLRSYGVPKENDNVFIELKKKFEGVVYKRRINMKFIEAQAFLKYHKTKNETQISKEINYCFELYKNLKPKVYLSYERIAYYGIENTRFRVTFDNQIIWRDYDLELSKGVYGEEILPTNMYLMEIKTDEAIPIWLANCLSKNKIYKQSFSKYGNVYKKIKEKEIQKENIYA